MKKILMGVLVFLLTGLSVGMAATKVEIEIEDFSFVPNTVTIMEGDTVEWTNRDVAGHSATSGSDGVPDGMWDSGILQMDQSYTYVFADSGTYPYFCTPHPFMTGEVIVEATADTTDTTEVPAVEEAVGDNQLELEVHATYVQLSVPATTSLRVGIYDLTGREIDVLASGFYSRGSYQIDLPRIIPGVYFVRLTTVSESITRRFTQAY